MSTATARLRRLATNMDYNDTSNILLLRIYCTTNRMLPMDEWTVFADLPFEPRMIEMDINLEPQFDDDAPRVMHYYYTVFYYKDGTEGKRSDVLCFAPGTDPASVSWQNPELN